MAISQVMDKLGIVIKEKGSIRSRFDLIALSKKGLPRKTITKLEKELSIKPQDIARL
jgi:hypothetical protein